MCIGSKSPIGECLISFIFVRHLLIYTQYNILPLKITSRLQLATSAMHAFGHQWACQLIYNPRLRPGLGLTDGEGTERLWSRLRKLIPIMRGCAVSKPHVSCLLLTDSISFTAITPDLALRQACIFTKFRNA